MEENIVIRKSKLSDLKHYRDLRLEALKLFPTYFSSDFLINDKKPYSYWEKRLQSSEKEDEGIIFFAELKEVLVGIIFISWENNPKVKHIANIGGVFVKPEFNGKGIGKSLMNRALEYIKNKNFFKIKLSVEVSNTKALNLYKNLGFEETGVFKNELFYDGKFYDELLMEKFLS